MPRKVRVSQTLLRELRAAALHYPGYVTGETLVSTEDRSIITVISTWRGLEDWKAWETSETRDKVYQQIRPLLLAEPNISTYHIVTTGERTG